MKLDTNVLRERIMLDVSYTFSPINSSDWHEKKQEAMDLIDSVKKWDLTEIYIKKLLDDKDNK